MFLTGIVKVFNSIVGICSMLIIILVFNTQAYADFSTSTVVDIGDIFFFGSPYSTDGGKNIDFAIDQDDNLYVAYWDSLNLEVRLIEKTGGSWGSPQSVFTNAGAQSVSIAIGGDGNPHIVCVFPNDELLYYTRWTGVSWSSHVVSSINVPYWTSLALDGADNPHIVYTDCDVGSLMYAKYDGISWSSSTIAGLTVDYLDFCYSSIVLDGEGKPRVIYTDLNGNLLKYAEWTGVSWSTSTVESADIALADIPIVLDGNGNPHVAYYDAGIGDLKYARWTGSSWDINIVESVAGYCVSLVLDGSGNPHLSYGYDTGDSTFDLKYSSSTDGGASFSNQIIDSVDDIGWLNTIALDGNGNLHIVYWDIDTEAIKYAVDVTVSLPLPMGGNPGSKVQSPTNFRATSVGGDNITWAWNDNSSNELGFGLYGAGSSSGPFTVIRGTDTITAGQTSYNETGLTAGSTYFRYIAAVNIGGVVWSSGTAVMAVVSSFPQSPTSLTGAINSATSIQWTWTDNADDEDGYRVCSDTAGIIQSLGSVSGSGGTTYWIEINLTPGQNYRRRVGAYNGAGVSYSDYFAVYLTDTIITDSSGGEIAVTDTIGETKVTLSSGALGQDAYVTIGLDPLITPREVDINSILGANSRDDADLLIDRLNETITEINAYTLVWTRLTGNFGAEVTVVIPYRDVDNDGIVDGTSPPIKEKTLEIYVLNETEAVWEFVGGTVDTSSNKVSADVSHFSVYVLMGLAPPLDLDDFKVYPNPYKPGTGGKFDTTDITFYGLPNRTKIKIFNIAGELVATLNEDNGDGKYVWSVQNDNGDKLASGVYIYYITNSDKARDKARGKFTIIR